MKTGSPCSDDSFFMIRTMGENADLARLNFFTTGVVGIALKNHGTTS